MTYFSFFFFPKRFHIRRIKTVSGVINGSGIIFFRKAILLSVIFQGDTSANFRLQYHITKTVLIKPFLCKFFERNSFAWIKQKKTSWRMSFLFGGEGGTRTLAPVLSQPTPLAGAPRHHLSTSPNVTSCLILNCLFGVLAERMGFEPMALSSHWFSRPAP